MHLSGRAFCSDKSHGFVSELKTVVKHHALLLAGGAMILLYGIVLSGLTGHVVRSSVSSFVFRYVLMAGATVFIAGAVWKLGRMLLVEHPRRPLQSMWHWVVHDVFSPSRLVNGVFGMTAIFGLVAGFSKAKNIATRFENYNWDAAWSDVDRMIHGGFYPHEILQPLLSTPWATKIIDLTYWLWYPVLFAACFVAAFQPALTLARHRFLVALILTWGVGGGMLSILFSSGGPVYFGNFTGQPDPYAAHMAFLREVHAAMPLLALDIQKIIWDSKTSVNGLSMISAMPSMHVAITALIWLACQASGVALRIMVSVFAVLIVFGSIHLGWHYAVDAYAGIMIAILSWQLALPISRWYLRWIGTPDLP